MNPESVQTQNPDLTTVDSGRGLSKPRRLKLVRPTAVWHATARFRPVLLLLVAGFIYLSSTQHYFFTNDNLQNLLNGVGILFVVGMGMTFVLLTGGADLSVAAVGTCAGILFAKLLANGVPGVLAVLITIVAAASAGGLINGVLISKFGLSFFVVTLASMTTLTGVAALWTHTTPVKVTAPIASDIAINKTAGLSNLIWIMIILLAVFFYVQTRTYFGRDIYAVGGNSTAARLAGIRSVGVVISVYAIAGACAGFSGIIGAGQIGSATTSVDNTVPLQAIAGVLLGGTSLFGGEGGVGGTALGVLFIGLIENGLSIAGVSSYWQNIVTGIILVIAVLGSQARYGGLLQRFRLRRFKQVSASE